MVIANPFTGESDCMDFGRNRSIPRYYDVPEFTEEEKAQILEEVEKKMNPFDNLKSDGSPTVNKTHTKVYFVLDKSGSMSSCKQEAITGFNKQLETLKSEAEPNHTFDVTVLAFSDDIVSIIKEKDVREVAPLNDESYVPGGFTAMYDGVGDALQLINKVPNSKDLAFLVCVISDGGENASTRHKPEAVAEGIKALQGRGNFTITYMGANQDLSQVSKVLNIPMGNMMSYCSSKEGTTRGLVANKASLDAYTKLRKTGVAASCNFYDKGNS
jgi:uncharacterized protein YegL